MLFVWRRLKIELEDEIVDELNELSNLYKMPINEIVKESIKVVLNEKT